MSDLISSPLLDVFSKTDVAITPMNLNVMG